MSAHHAILRRPRLLVALACALLLLPFVAKPLHMDDPMYVWQAEHILRAPLDPYGFAVNWRSTSTPMADEMKNPPLVCYYLAGAMLLLGRSEVALHAAMFLPAVGVVLGTWRLARELDAHPLLASLATLSTPVFLISATTVMADVAMLCAYVWAAWFWVRGMKSNRAWMLLAAALVAAVASLTKYFGVSLIPLLLADGLARRRKLGSWALVLLLPVIVLAAFELATRRLYGRGLLLDAIVYASETRQSVGRPLALRMLSALSFLGGGCLTAAGVLAVVTVRRARTVLAWALLLAAVMVALLALDPYAPSHPLRRPGGGVDWLFWVQWSAFVTAGIVILLAAAQDVWRTMRLGRGRPDPAALTPALWLLGTLVFAGVFNWSVNGRSILAAVPAAAVIAARAMARADPATAMTLSVTTTTAVPPSMERARRAGLAAVIILGGALAFVCARVDASDAAAARRAALAIHERFSPPPAPDGDGRSVYFSGHWGFQHYMQQLGARAIDPMDEQWRIGDLLVQPADNYYSIDFVPAAPDALPVVGEVVQAPRPYLATMHPPAHAGFYNDGWGPLPYALGRTAPSVYLVRRIDGPIRAVVWRQPPGGRR